ncbi:hypothetical protein ACHQM5_018740 [Ranunculus cassubicifolius]
MASSKMNKAVILFNIVLILSPLLIMSMAEGRLFGVGKGKLTPTCNKVRGVEISDTCFDIIKSNLLTATDFSAINPNINCNGLFVGQWVCIDGSVN